MPGRPGGPSVHSGRGARPSPAGVMCRAVARMQNERWHRDLSARPAVAHARRRANFTVHTYNFSRDRVFFRLVGRATACARAEGPGIWNEHSPGPWDLTYCIAASRVYGLLHMGDRFRATQSPWNVPLHEKRRWPVTSSCAIIPVMAIIASRPLFSSLVWSSLNSSALSGRRRNGSSPSRRCRSRPLCSTSHRRQWAS